MVVEFPDGVVRRQHEQCRIKLEDAQMRYLEYRTEPNLAAYRNTLKVFADLVLRRKVPEEQR